MATGSIEQTKTAHGERGASLNPLWFAAAALVVCLAYRAPVYVQNVQSKPHLEFALIIPLGAAVLFWARQTKINPVPVGPNAVSAGIAIFGLLLAFDAFLTRTGTSWILGVLFVLLAAIHAWGRWALFREVWPVWGFLWLMVPPPFGLDEKLITWLQLFVSQAASFTLDDMRIYHYLEGNVIRLEGQDLFVAEACSGVNSLFATFVVLVFAMLFFHRSWLHIIALFVLGFVDVLAVNIFRVVTLTWAHHSSPWLGKILDQEPWHSGYGMLCFVILIVLLVSSDALLFLFRDVILAVLPAPLAARISGREPDESEHSEPASPAPRPALQPLADGGLNWCYGLGGLALSLAALQFAAFGWGLMNPPPVPASVTSDPLPALMGNISGLLPAEWDGWVLVARRDGESAKDMEAMVSNVWVYQRGAEEMTVFLHRTYYRFHGLQHCYMGSGWQVKNIDNGPLVGEAAEQGPPGMYFVSFDIDRKPDGAFVLAYTHYDFVNREWVEPDIRISSLNFFERIGRTLSARTDALSRIFSQPKRRVETAALVIQLRTTRGAEAADRKEVLRRLASAAALVFKPLLSGDSASHPSQTAAR